MLMHPLTGRVRRIAAALALGLLGPTLTLSAVVIADDDRARTGCEGSGCDDAADGYTCVDTPDARRCPDLDELLRDGGAVSIPRGVYRQCAIIRRPTILDANGSLFLGGVCGGKATFVQRADFTLQHAECAEVKGDQGNEACIRRRHGRTWLEHVHFRDSYNGVLGGTGEALVIVDSTFERLGGSPGALGRAHGIYIKDGELILRNTTMRAAQWEGHLIKTGAAVTLIDGSLLDERGGRGSRVIDAFNGGEIEIRSSTIVAASGDGNSTVIGYDYEARRSHERVRLMLEDSSVSCAGGRLVDGRNSFSRLRVERDAATVLRSCR